MEYLKNQKTKNCTYACLVGIHFRKLLICCFSDKSKKFRNLEFRNNKQTFSKIFVENSNTFLNVNVLLVHLARIMPAPIPANTV